MDQELKAYLEERFGRVEERFGRMDERFERLETRMDERFKQVDERFKQVETETRHTRVLVEGLHGHVRLLAEAVVGTNERIDSMREQTKGKLDMIEANVKMIPDTLGPRVAILESRVERETRDTLEVIRERFGLRQA